MSTTSLLAVIGLIGVATFALRYSFIGTAQSDLAEEGSTLWHRALRYVPVAVLSALVAPALAYRDGALALSLGNPRLIAGLVAIVVAWRTRSVLATLAMGMGTLWLLQALG